MDLSRIYKIFCEFPCLSTDSRNIQPGCIFLALRGEVFNGNAFAEDALSRGASYAIVDDPAVVTSDKFILVSSTLNTLQHLALHHRKHFNLPVLAITGTNGKTTTRELITSVLSKKYNVLSTKGNLNNHIGVPLTLLELNQAHRIAVIEMGANHMGEISALCELAQPAYGLITNIGKAHLEGFGSFEGVIAAKTELYTYIRSQLGKVFVNNDNELLMKFTHGLSLVSYGLNQKADYRAEIIGSDPFLALKCSENCKVFDIQTHITGAYNAENVLAAVAIGRYFGVGAELLINAITSYKPQNNRSQIIDTGRNQLILDAYNANPSSMAAALNNFEKKSGQPKMIILGDMFELGIYSQAEHRNVLEIALRSKPGLIIFVGESFFRLKNNQTSCFFFQNTEEAKDWLRRNKIDGYQILIKGSRKNQLENLVENL